MWHITCCGEKNIYFLARRADETDGKRRWRAQNKRTRADGEGESMAIKEQRGCSHRPRINMGILMAWHAHYRKTEKWILIYPGLCMTCTTWRDIETDIVAGRAGRRGKTKQDAPGKLTRQACCFPVYVSSCVYVSPYSSLLLPCRTSMRTLATTVRPMTCCAFLKVTKGWRANIQCFWHGMAGRKDREEDEQKERTTCSAL